MTSTTALAIRGDQTMFDQYQRAVLSQLGIGDDVSNAELASYLHICQRTGLDPFSGQIHLIGRWDKQAGRKVYRPQTGIDGYRVIAQRTVERTSHTFGYEDTQWCDGTGAWTDVWMKPADPPLAAKVTVLRNGQRFPAIAMWREYCPTDKDGNPVAMWKRMMAGQLAKCAEALALRKAFPNDMAGVYTAEEMAQADSTEPHPEYRMVNDAERDAQGLMTAHQRVEHTALRRMNEPPPGAVEKLATTPEDDLWLQPEPEPVAETQGRKPGLDKLEALFAQLQLDSDEQDTVIAWFAPGEWTASTAQIRQVSNHLKAFLADAGGDVADARSALWDQYREIHGLKAVTDE